MGTGCDAVAPTEMALDDRPSDPLDYCPSLFFTGGGALETGFLCVLELAVLELSL